MLSSGPRGASAARRQARLRGRRDQPLAVVLALLFIVEARCGKRGLREDSDPGGRPPHPTWHRASPPCGPGYWRWRAARSKPGRHGRARLFAIRRASRSFLISKRRGGWRQQSFVSWVGTTLSFTYDSPAIPGRPPRSPRSRAISRASARVKTIYGDPFFGNTVNVRKDPSLGGGAFYSPTLDEIVLTDATRPSTTCHEMIHAFRDDFVIVLWSFEEGMTRATEIETFNQMAEYIHASENHSDIAEIHYEALARHTIGSEGGNVFLGWPTNIFLRYQLTAYAWAKALLENPSFFLTFNASCTPARSPIPQLARSRPCGDPRLVHPRSRIWTSGLVRRSAARSAAARGYFLFQRSTVRRRPDPPRCRRCRDAQVGVSVSWRSTTISCSPQRPGHTDGLAGSRSSHRYPRAPRAAARRRRGQHSRRERSRGGPASESEQTGVFGVIEEPIRAS